MGGDWLKEKEPLVAMQGTNNHESVLVTNKEQNQERMVRLIAGEIQECEEKIQYLTDDLNTLEKIFHAPPKGGGNRQTKRNRMR